MKKIVFATNNKHKLQEVKAILALYKKFSRRRAWVNGQRTGKVRKKGWKRM